MLVITKILGFSSNYGQFTPTINGKNYDHELNVQQQSQKVDSVSIFLITAVILVLSDTSCKSTIFVHETVLGSV